MFVAASHGYQCLNNKFQTLRQHRSHIASLDCVVKTVSKKLNSNLLVRFGIIASQNKLCRLSVDVLCGRPPIDQCAGSCIFPTDSFKFPTEGIMGAQTQFCL